MSSVTTPLSHVTSSGYNGLGVRTSRTDAMGRSTSYTLDNWERPVQANYPDGSVYTYGYDPDSNLTGFSDPTRTTTRTYDADNRLTSESKGGDTIKYTYDGTVNEKGVPLSGSSRQGMDRARSSLLRRKRKPVLPFCRNIASILDAETFTPLATVADRTKVGPASRTKSPINFTARYLSHSPPGSAIGAV
ncbi:MAG: hypothetical protein M1330_03565, partial [Armatimonadetes bacterium]|nr:hypothetical protein [Armatimonadota bacterium]